MDVNRIHFNPFQLSLGEITGPHLREYGVYYQAFRRYEIQASQQPANGNTDLGQLFKFDKYLLQAYLLTY